MSDDQQPVEICGPIRADGPEPFEWAQVVPGLAWLEVHGHDERER